MSRAGIYVSGKEVFTPHEVYLFRGTQHIGEPTDAEEAGRVPGCRWPTRWRSCSGTPIGRETLRSMLRDRYYIGWVNLEGVEYKRAARNLHRR